jgi:hypothetical protein
LEVVAENSIQVVINSDLKKRFETLKCKWYEWR